jgi:hypothetical protein
MWIDRKRQVELEQRIGLSFKVVAVAGILFIGTVAAYFFTDWLFSSGIMTHEFFYRELSITASVSPISIRIGLVLLMVISVQFLATMGVALLKPENRRRSGQASAVAQSPDFYDSQYTNY